MNVRQEAVEAIGDRGVDWVLRLVARAEHEVVDQELGAAVEELGQGPGSVVGVEAIVLVDLGPGQLAALAGQLVAHPGVLLLALQQFLASGLPLGTADNLVTSHRGLSPLSECVPGASGGRVIV